MSEHAVGRTKIPVDRDSLAYLRSLRFTWKDISDIMGPSPKTLRRRAAEWGIEAYSVVTDSELDEKVSKIKEEFPNSGEVMINGHLLAQNVHVQRQHLRNSISRLGNSAQISRRIYRRVYSVPGPNHLWHIDGNHKMIKYRLVIYMVV